MNINLQEIKLHASLQSRAEMNQETIDSYAELILEGQSMPPLLIYFDGVSNWLVDGYHRYFANKKAGIAEVDADIVNGTFREAELRSTGVNHDHGLPRSNADKRNAVMKLLNDLEWSEWSDREIARQCNVANMTVLRIKRSMEITSDVKKFVKNGKQAVMKTKDIGKVEAEPKEDKEDPVVAEMKEKLHSLSVAHESLAEENGSLIDRLAAASMDATEEEKELAQQTMTELRAIVKTLEAENHALKSSRDQLQSKNAELLKQVAYWRKKYEKTEKVAA